MIRCHVASVCASPPASWLPSAIFHQSTAPSFHHSLFLGSYNPSKRPLQPSDCLAASIMQVQHRESTCVLLVIPRQIADAPPHEGWQELHVPARRKCPKLFYSFSARKHSFVLLSTDLISLWDCSLDEDDILREAVRQHTSIDPSLSPDQFEVLLSKIRKGLNQGNSSLVRGTGVHPRTLVLRTRINLPRPLRALEWTFTLEVRPSADLGEPILRPAMHEVSIT